VSLGLKLTHGKDIEMTKAVMRVKPRHPEDEDEDEATNGEQGGERLRKGRSSAEAPAHAER
jgi:hypothetical protein